MSVLSSDNSSVVDHQAARKVTMMPSTQVKGRKKATKKEEDFDFDDY